MAFDKKQLKSELIDEVLERVHSRLEGEKAAQADHFVRSFYAHVPPDDIAGERPENLYGAALTLWRLAGDRQLDEHKVRVYNPRQESHGWKSAHTVLEIVIVDMPFLVDSVTAALQSLSADVHLVLYPVVHLKRDETGKRMALLPEPEDPESYAGDGVLAEALMHLQISEQPTSRHEEIHRVVSEVLADVTAAVEDWKVMKQLCRQVTDEIRESPPPLPADEIDEGTAFLDWLIDDSFTFLGYREYVFEGEGQEGVARVVEDSGMGILRDSATTIFAPSRSLAPMPDRVRRFLRRPELLVISKAGRRSTVHRPVHLDAVSAKTINEDGEVVGHRLFVGLFTSAAYAARPKRDPPVAPQGPTRPSNAPRSRWPGTAARRSFTFSTPTHGMSSFRSPKRNSSRLPWASCISRSVTASFFSRATTPSSASCRAWSTCPGIASTPGYGSRSKVFLQALTKAR